MIRSPTNQRAAVRSSSSPPRHRRRRLPARHRAAMLRLRCCILTRIRSYSATSGGSSLHWPISAAAAAPAVSPNPSSFAVEDYLVATCGLSRAHALKASAKLSHLKFPAKPDAVLSFLAGHSFSSSNVAVVVAGDPKVLCSSVEGYLGPVVAQLTSLGLSRSQIVRLISYCHDNLHLTSIVSKLQYYLPLFGSIDNTLRVLKRDFYLISSNLERVVKPNMAALRRYSGLGDCDIAKVCLAHPRLLITNVESIRAIVACAESLGVPHGSRMLRHAVPAVAFLGVEKIAAKVVYLKETFRWSDAQLGIAMSKFPILLTRPKDTLRSRSEFLISEAGLEPAYIAWRPGSGPGTMLLSFSRKMNCYIANGTTMLQS